MGFVRRMRTTDKPEIPDQAVKEAKLLFQHQIVSIVEDDEIPESLIMNFDQTPLKYAPVSNSTLAKKGSKHIPITGGASKNQSWRGNFRHHIFGQVFANATNI